MIRMKSIGLGWFICLGLASTHLIGCVSLSPYETYGFEQLQYPEISTPADIGKLVYIAGGEFSMGVASTDQGKLLREHPDSVWVKSAMPPIRVRVPSFLIGKYEVTANEYCLFLNECLSNGEDVSLFVFCDKDGMTTIAFDGEFHPLIGYENAPATAVSYMGARRYCEWLSEKTGDAIRLPSEVEWEYAARGPEGRTYPWGEETPLGRAFLQSHYVNVHRGFKIEVQHSG